MLATFTSDARWWIMFLQNTIYNKVEPTAMLQMTFLSVQPSICPLTWACCDDGESRGLSFLDSPIF